MNTYAVIVFVGGWAALTAGAFGRVGRIIFGGILMLLSGLVLLTGGGQ